MKCDMCDDEATQHLIVKKGFRKIREFNLCELHFDYQLCMEQQMVPYGYELNHHKNL